MENEKQTKMKKSTKYLLIGTLVLFLSIIGASVAYYLARVSGNLSGRAAGTEMELTITPLSNNATGDLIPLDNDLETLGLAAKGYENNGACVDINGYSVCQIYRVRVSNKGSVPLQVNGTVTLYGQDTPNIDCAVMDDEVTVTNNNSCMGTNTLANNVTLPANNHLDYYVMVYIKNLDEPQYDKGEFNGTVVFTSTQGNRVKGRFKPGENIVEHITDLYNSAEKTTVHHSTYVLDDNSSSTSGVSNTNKKANSMLLSLDAPKTPGTPSTIDYHYAPSVGLMNDRLGGTTESLDDGNIRYYGAKPNNYIDIGDYVKEIHGNWENANEPQKPEWTDSESCKEVLNCSKHYTEYDFETEEECNNDFSSKILPYETIEDFCTTTETKTSILWRIIGVFDGKIRIVRDEPIGNYSWDTSSSDINSGNGINEWSQADLMKLLNPGHENNTDQICTTRMQRVCNPGKVGSNCHLEPVTTCNEEADKVNNSLYWNNQSGICYISSNNGTIPCDFTNKGLSDEAKEYVIDQTIYLGGFDYDDQATFANQAYQLERGTKVIQNPSDGVTRTLSWTGKVGLPYPSDYGYAADLSRCSENLSNYKSSNCRNNNWLYLNNDSQFMISPYIKSNNDAVIVNSFGQIFNGLTFRNYSIRPVLTLSSDTYIISGAGTSDDPYVVG